MRLGSNRLYNEEQAHFRIHQFGNTKVWIEVRAPHKIMKMDALLAIPEEISRHILSVWLTLAELSRLDVAYCNHLSRLTFQGLIGEKLCSFSNALSGRSRWLQSREQLNWLFKRSVAVKNLTLCAGESDTDAALMAYLERGCGGASLQSVELIQQHDRTSFSLVRTASIVSKYSAYVKELRFSYLMNLSGKVLRKFADGCPSIESLHLDYCDFAEESDMVWSCVVSQSWYSTLVHLSVSHTSCTDEDVAIIVRACCQLQHLDISKCDVTDASVFEIAAHCPHLTFISLNDTDVGDESVTVLAQSCVRLREVALGLNGRITDVTLQSLAMHCQALHSLDISECENITDAGMDIIALYCPHLTVLDISESLGVTEVGALTVAESCKQLQMFRVHETMTSAALLELMGERVEITRSFSQDDWLTEQGGRYWKSDVHEIDIDGEPNSVCWGRGRVNSDY